MQIGGKPWFPEKTVSDSPRSVYGLQMSNI